VSACCQRQRHPSTAIFDHLLPIDIQPRSTDLPPNFAQRNIWPISR
jgi:hypothetical protein